MTMTVQGYHLNLTTQNLRASQSCPATPPRSLEHWVQEILDTKRSLPRGRKRKLDAISETLYSPAPQNASKGEDPNPLRCKAPSTPPNNLNMDGRNPASEAHLVDVPAVLPCFPDCFMAADLLISFQLRTPSTPAKQSSPSGRSRTSRSSVKSGLSEEMDRHGMLQNNSAFEQYPLLRRLVDDIVKVPRPASAVKERSAKKFRHHLKTYKNSNEDTFLEAVMPLVFKDSFTVPAPVHGALTPPASVPNDSPQDVEETVIQVVGGDGPDLEGEWWDQGQKFTVNQLFAHDMLPNAYLDDGFPELLAHRLAKEKGMTKPKPDRIWGIDRRLRPTPKGVCLSDSTKKALEIVPTLHSPYLLLEGKSNHGNHAMAEEQARRGGATLVNCALKIQDLARQAPNLTSAAHEVNAEGQASSSSEHTGGGEAEPDLNAIVFSATLDPTTIQFWVHWAERFPDKSLRFHMNWVAAKPLMDPDAQGAIRTWSQNIHTWACLTRRQYLDDLYANLYRYEQNLTRGVKRKATGGQDT